MSLFEAPQNVSSLSSLLKTTAVSRINGFTSDKNSQ